MLDIVQSFPLLSYCIVSPIYISPICNVEIHYSEKIKIRNSLFFSLHKMICIQGHISLHKAHALGAPCASRLQEAFAPLKLWVYNAKRSI